MAATQRQLVPKGMIKEREIREISQFIEILSNFSKPGLVVSSRLVTSLFSGFLIFILLGSVLKKKTGKIRNEKKYVKDII